MVIHVVMPGDTAWTLSRRYGVSMESIVETNRLQDIPHLVVGQALVIPTTETAYAVRPGDSLWSIARRFGTSVQAIARLNNISNSALIYPGMVLRIPQGTDIYGSIEVNGYIEPSTAENERRIMAEVGRYLTYVSPFSYQVNPDGSLTSINDTAILSAAAENRVAPMMVITNFRNGNFDSNLAHTILSQEQVQQTLMDNVIRTMGQKGYRSLNIDFERIPPEDRQLYNNFLRRVMDRMRPQGYLVSTALAPKPEDLQTGAWHGAHDYRAHGEIVDFSIIMTYEWGWSGGPPFAVAPINLVRDVIEFAASVMPSRKIMMGIPLYGYDWTLPYTPGGRWARRISPQQAIALAARYNTSIRFNEQYQSPFFNYTADDGSRHEVWFEDARSVDAKFRLVNEFNLRGVSYWVLGQQFPQNWAVLDDRFEIVKLA